MSSNPYKSLARTIASNKFRFVARKDDDELKTSLVLASGALFRWKKSPTIIFNLPYRLAGEPDNVQAYCATTFGDIEMEDLMAGSLTFENHSSDTIITYTPLDEAGDPLEDVSIEAREAWAAVGGNKSRVKGEGEEGEEVERKLFNFDTAAKALMPDVVLATAAGRAKKPAKGVIEVAAPDSVESAKKKPAKKTARGKGSEALIQRVRDLSEGEFLDLSGFQPEKGTGILKAASLGWKIAVKGEDLAKHTFMASLAFKSDANRANVIAALIAFDLDEETAEAAYERSVAAAGPAKVAAKKGKKTALADKKEAAAIIPNDADLEEAEIAEEVVVKPKKAIKKVLASVDDAVEAEEEVLLVHKASKPAIQRRLPVAAALKPKAVEVAAKKPAKKTKIVVEEVAAEEVAAEEVVAKKLIKKTKTKKVVKADE